MAGAPDTTSRGVWTLHTHLAVLLMLSMLLTLALVGSGVLLYRIPRIERDSQQLLERDVRDLAARTEVLLDTRQSRLELLATLLHGRQGEPANALLDEGVADGDMLRVVYLLSPQGRVLAVGLPMSMRARRNDLLGSDLSSNSLFQALDGRQGSVWSGRYLSALTGLPTAGVAHRTATGALLLAEVPFSVLLETVDAAAGRRSAAIWLVDQSGEVIADTDRGLDAGDLNIRDWPLMKGLLHGGPVERRLRMQGSEFRVATAHSPALGWYFVGHGPLGLDHPEVRGLVLAVGATAVGCLLIGLLMAPVWAIHLARPLQAIVERAEQALRGGTPRAATADGNVVEFNQLSQHLAAMAASMRERELKFAAVFNGSPVPMTVTDANDEHKLIAVNDAWCQVLQHRREDALGRTGIALKMFSVEERGGLVAGAQRERFSGEITLRRRDGQAVPVQAYGQYLTLGSQRWLIWASVETGPMRRVQQALRDLNQALEDRVQRRTEALSSANAALSQTVEQLHLARRELVRAEKMAALGSLVAGVAHELNTPMGNGMMAVSALADAVRSFRAAMATGVKRSDLQQLVDSLEQGTDIGLRNLQRAADLVQSFKQVAVDQTSSKRRSFELAEVVHEMVVSLQPSFADLPYRVEVEVPAQGLRMDSYPGPLGQTLGNLIQNAMLHGLAGRAQGTVRISAGRAEDGWIWLRVADDGRGIAPEHLDRIFEPFMTTRMGRGSTGLGLHISHNAVANLLGGTLAVTSLPGQGACFELRMPATAPELTTEPGALTAWRETVWRS